MRNPVANVVLTGIFSLILLRVVSGCSDRMPIPHSSPTVLTKLFFGRSIGDSGFVSDSAWSTFQSLTLASELQLGFTVYNAWGYWAPTQGTLHSEPTIVVEVIHTKSDDFEKHLQTVINEYKQRFKQDSVMRISLPILSNHRTEQP